jgi:hypothetical protein
MYKGGCDYGSLLRCYIDWRYMDRMDEQVILD